MILIIFVFNFGYFLQPRSGSGRPGMIRNTAFRAAYSASKHALQAFSDSLRAEVASAGVHVLGKAPIKKKPY